MAEGQLYIWQLILILPIGLIVVLAFVAAGIRLVKVISLNNRFNNNLDIDYSCLYGGLGNIESVKLENGIISVTVKDMSLASTLALKDVKAKKVSVNGNTISAKFNNTALVLKRLEK